MTWRVTIRRPVLVKFVFDHQVIREAIQERATDIRVEPLHDDLPGFAAV